MHGIGHGNEIKHLLGRVDEVMIKHSNLYTHAKGRRTYLRIIPEDPTRRVVAACEYVLALGALGCD